MPARPQGARNTCASRLLGWFDQAQRDLPWRKSRDPWAIWVSEIMLQQTRVEAVRAAFERFLARYPEPAAFAEASDDEVMVAWRGLGYYRRARLLRDGAKRVVEVHGGVVPNSLEQLRELPGIGPYTLGAVASIAFGHPEPAVDGNVERVVSRHRGLEEPIATGPARRQIRGVIETWMPKARAGDFNQSLMELGATVCTPTSPSCEACPIAADCVAWETGRTDELPVKKPPRKAVEVTARAAVVTRESTSGSRQVLGFRVPHDQPNAGQVELPGPGILSDCDPDDLARAIHQRFGAAVTVDSAVASIKHAITHHRITLHAHAATAQTLGQLGWFSLVDETPWTTPSRKVFGRLFQNSSPLDA